MQGVDYNVSQAELVSPVTPIEEPKFQIKVSNPILSIVMPTYNALDYTKQTVESIFATTKTLFELIIIDNCSTDGVTKEWLEQIESPQVTITKIFNVKNYWVNYAWNLGAQIAKGKYVATLNNDIILSDSWDTKLIKLLDSGKAIACPTELKEDKDGKKFLQEIHPFVRETDPNMINGACFMYKKEDIKDLFPIPPELKHWCGDNWLADRANGRGGVGFDHSATFKHFVTRSGSTVDPEVYHNRVLQDIEAYERISDRNMKKIKERIQNPQQL